MSRQASGSPGDYEPSPSERVRRQVELYERTDGVEGGTLEGKPVVIVTSKGAKSGKIRKTPVMRIKQGDTYVVVASAAGATSHPAWYHNLKANPLVRLQDGAQVREMTAHEVYGAEKSHWWTVADAHWPHFPEYRDKANREIPILILEPLGVQAPA
ncbi:nitroreductase family deazaflavin-dependent oxidoreductase [Streptomyces sp. S1D4-11]|nr:nitroreductase family deazaflavin-dependent oxidoreductase [Streptomyces sp. S1D4-11]QIZ01125.1 nitroreductase family deazaflavin-dependent oxidoreductase [Streptomyces sp. S1D4-11]